MYLSELDFDCAVDLTFSGDDSTNSVEFWMRKFKEYAEIRGFCPDGTLRVAKSKLRGSARTWFSYQNNINTWEHFQELILAEFKTDVPILQEMMGSKKKHPNQSIMNYIHEMRLLGHRAQVDDQDIMELIIKGATEDKYLRAILRTAPSFKMLRKILEGFEEDSQSYSPVTHGLKSVKASPYSRPTNIPKPQLSLPAVPTAELKTTPTAFMQPIIAPAASIGTPMYAYSTNTNPFYGYRHY